MSLLPCPARCARCKYEAQGLVPVDQATRTTPRSKRPAADLAVFPRVDKRARPGDSGGAAGGEVSSGSGRGRRSSEGAGGQVGCRECEGTLHC